MRFWSLTGHTSYEEARRLQLELVELRAEGKIPDTFLFLEHAPVITRGRGLQFTGTPSPRHMPLPVVPQGVEFAESERGGDLTYHGPGQLVVYPICALDGQGFGPRRDIGGFLRKLETVLIDELASLGLSAEMRENATGVWIGDRKVASIGIAVRRWVTYHGMAICCVGDQSAFHAFSPCGFSSEVMTRLGDLLPEFLNDPHWRITFELRLAQRIAGEAQPQILRLSARDALSALGHDAPHGAGAQSPNAPPPPPAEVMGSLATAVSALPPTATQPTQ